MGDATAVLDRQWAGLYPHVPVSQRIGSGFLPYGESLYSFAFSCIRFLHGANVDRTITDEIRLSYCVFSALAQLLRIIAIYRL